MRYITQVFAALFLVFFVGTAEAQRRAFGQWASDVTSAGVPYAATINDSNHVLGQYCFTATACVYLLGISNSCTAGHKYVLLVNSDKGSRSLNVYCDGQLEGGKYRYVFYEFEEIHRIVLEAYRVGFAFPLEAGDFIVIRFSLVGSNEAIAAMNAVNANPVPVRRQGTRDQRL